MRNFVQIYYNDLLAIFDLALAKMREWNYY
jgi:hypothetical protein